MLINATTSKLPLMRALNPANKHSLFDSDHSGNMTTFLNTRDIDIEEDLDQLDDFNFGREGQKLKEPKKIDRRISNSVFQKHQL